MSTTQNEAAAFRKQDVSIPFEENFRQLAGERAQEGFGEFLRRSPTYRKVYRETLKQREAIGEEIAKAAGEDLLQEYDDLNAILTGLEAEAGYVIGLKDGLRLACELWGLDGRNGHGEEAR